MNPRRVQDVQPVGDTANPVHLSVEILNRWRVVVVVAVEEEALCQCRFPYLQRSNPRDIVRNRIRPARALVQNQHNGVN